MSDTHSRPVRTRIAPSPTGLPHVGTVRNALTGELSSADEEDIQICVSVPAGDVELDL